VSTKKFTQLIFFVNVSIVRWTIGKIVRSNGQTPAFTT